MKCNVLLSLVAATSLAFGASSALAQNKDAHATPKEQPKKDTTPKADHGKHDEHAAHQAKVGEKAPDFTLTDTDGKTVSLAELTKQKKIVVLEWFNPECPYSGVKQYEKTKTMQDTAKAYKDKGVVWLAINSGDSKSTGAKEANAKFRTDHKVEYPILLDPTGAVGKAYQSKNTPTMYVINAEGTLVYWGAIDDNNSADTAGKVNYVKKALDEVLAGQTVTESQTKAYGCKVNYSDKPEHAADTGKTTPKKNDKK